MITFAFIFFLAVVFVWAALTGKSAEQKQAARDAKQRRLDSMNAVHDRWTCDDLERLPVTDEGDNR